MGPVAVLLPMLLFTVTPAVVGHFYGRDSLAWRAAVRWPTIGAGIGLTVVAFTSTSYVLAILPWIEGTDLYYYLAISRDMIDRSASVDARDYFYLPGVFAFWRSVIRIFGFDWTVLKTAYAFIIFLNVLLVGAVALRAGAGLLLSTYAGLFYLALGTRLELFYGLTEPIATVFFLGGVAWWAGGPLQGSKGWIKAAGLGVGLGLTVYVKQQAGLLALGFLAMLPGLFVKGPEGRHHWARVLLIPLVAIAVLVTGVLLEGRGFMPLSAALAASVSYPPQRGFWENLAPIRWLVGVESQLVMALVVLILLYMIASRRIAQLDRPALRVIGFCLVACLASLYQFTRRHYPHYALLTIAALAPVVALVIAQGIKAAPRALRSSPAVAAVLLFTLALPFAGPIGDARFAIYAFPVPQLIEFGDSPAWRLDPAVASDLERASQILAAGDDVLILPPSRNEIHLALGTQSESFELGYGYAESDASRALDDIRLDGVIIVTDSAAHDNVNWELARADEVVRRLPSSDFELIADLTTIQVWRRRSE